MKVIIFIILTSYTICDNLRLLEDQSLNPIYQNFFELSTKTQCNTNNNCPPPNFCKSNSICRCQTGFAHFPSDSQLVCSYKMKKQVVAFLLQFFLFHGAGQFYVGNTKYAVPQLLLCLLCCCLPCISACMGMGMNFKNKDNPDQRSGLTVFLLGIYCLTTCTVFAWWLADIIIFGMNNFTDSNGIPLDSW